MDNSKSVDAFKSSDNKKNQFYITVKMTFYPDVATYIHHATTLKVCTSV